MTSLGDMLLGDDTAQVGHATRDPFKKRSAITTVGLSPSLTTPAAKPVEPKDADKALVNTALGTLRLNGWYCQEDESYRSFVLSVKIRTPKRGVIATDNFRVYADGGLLYFEQLVLQLPGVAVGQLPILETLNEINQRSVSAVFVLHECGVIMRHVLLPRSKQDGYFSVAMMVQTMRQMYHDRREALTLLRQVVESCGTLDPLVVAQTFLKPMASLPIGCLTLMEIENLASFAGFFTINDGKQILLAKDRMPPDRCPVRLTCSSGYLRGEATIGDIRNGRYSWRHLPVRMRNLIRSGTANASKYNEVYEKLNLMNLEPGPVRYVAVLKSLVALGAAFPTDQDITIDQFKMFASALLEHSNDGEKALPVAVARRAG